FQERLAQDLLVATALRLSACRIDRGLPYSGEPLIEVIILFKDEPQPQNGLCLFSQEQHHARTYTTDIVDLSFRDHPRSETPIQQQPLWMQDELRSPSNSNQCATQCGKSQHGDHEKPNPARRGVATDRGGYDQCS